MYHYTMYIQKNKRWFKYEPEHTQTGRSPTIGDGRDEHKKRCNDDLNNYTHQHILLYYVYYNIYIQNVPGVLYSHSQS